MSLGVRPDLSCSSTLRLDSMRDALARAGVAGIAVLARLDHTRDGECEGEPDNDALGPVVYVPILPLDHPDFDEAYGLLCCHWILWLRVAHCSLRVEATHVVVCVSVDAIDHQTFDLLLASIKKAEMCFL